MNVVTLIHKYIISGIAICTVMDDNLHRMPVFDKGRSSSESA
jgi:hypothetical protein